MPAILLMLILLGCTKMPPQAKYDYYRCTDDRVCKCYPEPDYTDRLMP